MNEVRIRLKEEYRQLYTDIESMLFKHDPVGINFGFNTDAYDPEMDTILPRLREAKYKDDVAAIIYEEFVRWCDADIAGKKADPAYAAMASEVRAAWLRYRRQVS